MKTPKLSYSAAKLLILICRKEAAVEGTADELYPDEWARRCQPSAALEQLLAHRLVSRFGWGTRQFTATAKGMKIYR